MIGRRGARAASQNVCASFQDFSKQSPQPFNTASRAGYLLI